MLEMKYYNFLMFYFFKNQKKPPDKTAQIIQICLSIVCLWEHALAGVIFSETGATVCMQWRLGERLVLLILIHLQTPPSPNSTYLVLPISWCGFLFLE
jgi:hypothetical protein